MRGVSLLGVALTLGCASARSLEPSAPAPRPLARAVREQHQHDCVTAAERRWSERQRSLERASPDRAALATLRAGAERGADSAFATGPIAASLGAQQDLTTTARIRRALQQHGSLSFAARNVKIVTSNGRVVLSGAVENAREREIVESIAREIAGHDKVDNRL